MNGFADVGILVRAEHAARGCSQYSSKGDIGYSCVYVQINIKERWQYAIDTVVHRTTQAIDVKYDVQLPTQSKFFAVAAMYM